MLDRISCGQHPSRKLLHTRGSSNFTLYLLFSPKIVSHIESTIDQQYSQACTCKILIHTVLKSPFFVSCLHLSNRTEGFRRKEREKKNHYQSLRKENMGHLESLEISLHTHCHCQMYPALYAQPQFLLYYVPVK